jgi:exodeoxyribonuclease-5
MVVYRNERRQALNNYIRKQIFGEAANERFLPGEPVMFNDNFKLDKEITIENATEVSVIDSYADTKNVMGKKYNTTVIEIEHPYFEDETIEVSILNENQIAEYQRQLDAFAEKIKAKPKYEQGKYWKQFYYYKNEVFANVDYSYVITSHKSQGSTYETVFVDAQDINSVSSELVPNISKARSIYTAITRASKTAIMFSGNIPNNAVISQEQINTLEGNNDSNIEELNKC